MAIFLGKQYLGQSDKVSFEEKGVSKIDTMLKEMKGTSHNKSQAEPVENHVDNQTECVQPEADSEFQGSNSQD
jgi:hypothetical protein